MASKGFRSDHVSGYIFNDAGCELRKPLNPLLAIACVIGRLKRVFFVLFNRLIFLKVPLFSKITISLFLQCNLFYAPEQGFCRTQGNGVRQIACGC